MNLWVTTAFERALVLGGYTSKTVVRIVKLAEILFPFEVTCIKGKMCPYCGHTFRYRSSLYLHLVRGFRNRKSCYYSFQNLINVTIREYQRFRMHYVKLKSGEYVVFVPCSDKRVKFRTYDEAFSWWVKHVLGVKASGGSI